jgi:transcriptional regulator GlxA family with amidase domain
VRPPPQPSPSTSIPGRPPREIAADLKEALAKCDEAIVRSERLRRVRNLVAAHSPELPSRVEAAKTANLHPTSFSKFFRKEVGVTWAQWTNSLRLARVLELLRDTNWPVPIVARESGFSERTLRRVCRREFGLGPRALRKLLR